MADSGGHWNTLAEAEKLTQKTLIPGVIEETIKRGNLLEMVPVAQAANSGVSIDWVRESTTVEGDVADVAVGEQLSWTEGVTYTTVSTKLKISYVQRKLDDFVASIYGNVNNYEAIKLREMQKGVMLKVGDKFIYDDITYGGAKQFDGLHALAALQTGTALDVDGGEAGLSVGTVRALFDAMSYGVDVLYVPFNIGRRIDAAYQETGFAGLASATAGTMGTISFSQNEAGKRITWFDGVPIMRSDFLVAEQANVGDGSNLRAKRTSGDNQYSVFAIKFGQVMLQQPGLSMAFGGTSELGQFFKVVLFDELEDYDAGGMRLVSYVAPLLGSTKCLGRIFDIDDLAITI